MKGSKPLKFTLTVEGEEGSDEAHMTMSFAPAIGGPDDHAWEGTGAAIMAGEIIQTVKRLKDEAHELTP